MTKSLSPPLPKLQRGVALVVSMVMLLAITVIGITVMGGSRLEWLMASNSHFQTTAYMNAETALAAGLSTLPAAVIPIMPSYPPLSADATNMANWNDNTITGTPAGPNGAYVAEYLGCSAFFHGSNIGKPYYGACSSSTFPEAKVYTYRVWAIGRDSKGAARILEATHLVSTQSPAVLFPQKQQNQAEIP